METETMIEKLIVQMQYDLLHYSQESIKKKIKRILRNLMRVQHIDKPDNFFWPNAMIAEALVESLIQYPQKETQKVLEQYVNQWIQKNKQISYVDQIMNGYAICELYEKNAQSDYLNILEQMKRYLLHCDKASDGSLLYRSNQKEYVYADSLGMVCPFLCRYSVLSGEKKLADLAIKQFTNFREHGYDAKSGLPYHAYHAGNGEKLGIIGWGRAVGWILTGMSDSMQYLQEQDLEIVQKLFCELGNTIITYQRIDGFFSWQLQAMEGPRDISATSMILGALQVAVKKKFLDEKFERVIEKGKNAILSTQNVLSSCLAECEGLGSYPQYYDRYPWGDAATARLLLQ